MGVWSGSSSWPAAAKTDSVGAAWEPSPLLLGTRSPCVSWWVLSRTGVRVSTSGSFRFIAKQRCRAMRCPVGERMGGGGSEVVHATLRWQRVGLGGWVGHVGKGWWGSGGAVGAWAGVGDNISCTLSCTCGVLFVLESSSATRRLVDEAWGRRLIPPGNTIGTHPRVPCCSPHDLGVVLAVTTNRAAAQGIASRSCFWAEKVRVHPGPCCPPIPLRRRRHPLTPLCDMPRLCLRPVFCCGRKRESVYNT